MLTKVQYQRTNDTKYTGLLTLYCIALYCYNDKNVVWLLGIQYQCFRGTAFSIFHYLTSLWLLNVFCKSILSQKSCL